MNRKQRLGFERNPVRTASVEIFSNFTTEFYDLFIETVKNLTIIRGTLIILTSITRAPPPLRTPQCVSTFITSVGGVHHIRNAGGEFARGRG